MKKTLNKITVILLAFSLLAPLGLAYASVPRGADGITKGSYVSSGIGLVKVVRQELNAAVTVSAVSDKKDKVAVSTTVSCTVSVAGSKGAADTLVQNAGTGSLLNRPANCFVLAQVRPEPHRHLAMALPEEANITINIVNAAVLVSYLPAPGLPSDMPAMGQAGGSSLAITNTLASSVLEPGKQKIFTNQDKYFNLSLNRFKIMRC